MIITAVLAAWLLLSLPVALLIGRAVRLRDQVTGPSTWPVSDREAA